MTPGDALKLLERLNLRHDHPPSMEDWRELLRQIQNDGTGPVPDRHKLDRALVREAPVVTFTLSVEDGSITSLNPAFKHLTDWPQEKWLSRPLTDLAHAEDLPTLVAGIHQVILGETPSPFELRLKTQRSAYVTAECVLKPLVDQSRAVAVLGFAYDVSDRKMAERDLSASKDAAEAANQAKGEFLANMSHEIRTPMNAIVAMTSLLLDTPLNNEQRSFTETLKASCHTLLDLIDDILDFSKIESGKLELEKQPFDLRRMVADATYMVSSQAAVKDIEVSFAFSDACPEGVEGDVVRIRQVLVNLLSNAVKFTDQGSVKVWVDATPTGDGRLEIRFEVSDTGCGIAPEQQERIFDAFSQAQASTSRRYGGTGLGLSISRRLTELMGGEIGVESQEGQGSLFYFTVDARLARLPIRGEISEEFDAQLALKHPLDILVTDDNPTNQQVAKLLLARRGYRADTVSGGHEAIRALNKKRYDLVLMDMLMPQMDGLQATREILRLFPEGRRPQIVAMTASAMQGDREQCLEAGMVDFLSKPINEDELETILILCSNRAQRPKRERACHAESREPARDDEPEDDRQDISSHTFEQEPVLTPLLSELYREKPDRVPPLVHSFLDHTQQAIRDLEEQADADNAERVHEIAHSLKGSCQTLGARRLGAISAELEASGRHHDLTLAPFWIDQLKRELVPVQDRLSSFLGPSESLRV